MKQLKKDFKLALASFFIMDARAYTYIKIIKIVVVYMPIMCYNIDSKGGNTNDTRTN